MELENFLYARVQIAHNFGAAAVTGFSIAALWLKPGPSTLRRMAWLTLLAWLVQAASGAGFGTVSFFEEGELPQIHHLALAALSIKIFCAALAVPLLAIHFLRHGALGPGVAT
jgi:preprotein translocase subunit Sec61beta